MQFVLQVKNLSKEFKSRQGIFRAVDRVSFDLNRAEVLGFLGPNGAGKTTTIQMLLGALKFTEGEIYYSGKELSKHRTEIARQVSFASSYTQLPWRLTVLENLDVYARLYSIKAAERKSRARRFLEAFDAWHLRNKPFGSLSAGQMTRVQLAKAFISYPKICLLDEPTASLDPDIAHEVRNFIREQQREYGVSMLYTSHNMDEVTELCDRVVFLKAGKVVACDNPERLAQNGGLTRIELSLPEQSRRLEEMLVAADSQWQRNEQGTYCFALKQGEVGRFLSELGLSGIAFNDIHIERPTLEEYFLQLAKEAA